MKGNIEYCLTRLVEQFVRDSTGKVTVIFADGTRRMVDGGEAVDMVPSQPDKVGRVTATDKRNRLLPDLLNGLLAI